MTTTTTDYRRLGRQINDLDFDTVFRIEDGALVTMRYIHAPSVYHDEDNDVFVDGDGWSCITGLTGQYGYRGAVMHPSEYVGAGIAEVLVEDFDPDTDTIFAMVVVTDLDAEEGEDDGWAIVYRSLARR